MLPITAAEILEILLSNMGTVIDVSLASSPFKVMGVSVGHAIK